MTCRNECYETSTDCTKGAPGFTSYETFPVAPGFTACESFPDSLVKKKVLNVLVAIIELEEVVAKDPNAIFEPVMKKGVDLIKSLNKLQVELVKMERKKLRDGPAGGAKDGRVSIRRGPVDIPIGGPGAGIVPDFTTKLPKMCTRFHASPKLACSAGVPAGHASGTAGWCMFAH
jgi:hypothetical protein